MPLVRIIRYLVSGGACALVEYLLLVLFFEKLGLSIHLANFLALFLASSANYLLSRYWIFGSSHRRVPMEAALFAVVVAFSFLTNHAAFLGLYQLVGLDYKLSKVLSMAFTVVVNYKCKRLLVFPSRPSVS